MSNNIALIQKYLAKTISPEESKQLEAWLDQDPSHRIELRQYEQLWDLSAAYKSDIEVDTEAGLTRFRERVGFDSAQPTSGSAQPTSGSAQTRTNSTDRSRSRVMPLFWMASAAAVLFLLVAVGFLSNFLSNDLDNLVETHSSELSTSLQLADGTTVFLNKNSTLSYPEQFAGETRTVHLSGEAFFDVSKDAAHPFIIKTAGSEVKVLGTSFNVRAYPDETQTEVAVSTGKVQFAGRDKDKKLKFVLLSPNEKATYQREQKEISKQQDPTLNSSSWKTKTLTFVDSPVLEVLDAVAKHYTITLESTKSTALNCVFNSSFQDANLEEVLSSLRLSLGLSIKKTATATYQVSGGNPC